MSSDEELYTGDLTILVDDDNATNLDTASVWTGITNSITKKKDHRLYVDNALNRSFGRVGLPVWTAVTKNDEEKSALSADKRHLIYIDNPKNRSLGRVEMPYYLESDFKDKKVYDDNPKNRRLGRVGKPKGTAFIKNDDAERAFYDKKVPCVYVDNARNRRFLRVGKGTAVTKNDDDPERSLDDKNDPGVYADSAQNRKLRRVGLPMGTAVTKNDDPERALDDKKSPRVYADTTINRKLGRVGSPIMTILGSNIKTVSPIQSFSDNDSYWRKCLVLNDKRYAYKALLINELPDQDELNELVQHFGRKSKVISAICDKISSYIKAKDECIVDVWAAYKVDCNKIVFVIIVDKRINFGKNVEYSFIKKQKGDVSYEGEDVINKSSVAVMSSADQELLRKSINLNNVDLMKKHKYLMMISGSPVRSKGFDNHSHTVTSETCIVLYVLIKGFIPIREDPFEKQYDGVAVDVREGFFQLFTGTANTYHEHLKNGCQVHREQLGTLGGFVDYQGFGTCGITCAHVLLNPWDMKCLAATTENLMDCGFSASGQTVYQPDNTQEHHAIGKVLKAIYKQGGGGESGMDIALVKIDQRYPQFGDFPSLEDGTPSNIQFDSGKTAHYAGIQSGDVLKFGATTGLTYGSIVMDTSTLSVRTYQPYIYNEDYEIILHNLLEIRTTVGHSSFAEPGDSGALVFCTGENNELCCVGVVEGGTKHKTCVVMPITPILQQFNLVSLKCFDKNRMLEHFERKTRESFVQLKNEITKEIIQTIHSTYSSLETRILQYIQFPGNPNIAK